VDLVQSWNKGSKDLFGGDKPLVRSVSFVLLFVRHYEFNVHFFRLYLERMFSGIRSLDMESGDSGGAAVKFEGNDSEEFVVVVHMLFYLIRMFSHLFLRGWPAYLIYPILDDAPYTV
jgi:hypothetical protein